MNGNINELIALNNKMSVLLQEYKQSLEEEQADYIVDKVSPMCNEEACVLIKKNTESERPKELCFGSKLHIEKFIKKRNIDKVYWRI